MHETDSLQCIDMIHIGGEHNKGEFLLNLLVLEMNYELLCFMTMELKPRKGT